MISKISPDPVALDFTSFTNVINGQNLNTKATIHGINPATLEALPEVPVSTKQEIDLAVESAKVAFKSWKNVPWEERSERLKAFADGLLSYKAEFANLLVREQGKPVCA